MRFEAQHPNSLFLSLPSLYLPALAHAQSLHHAGVLCSTKTQWQWAKVGGDKIDLLHWPKDWAGEESRARGGRERAVRRSGICPAFAAFHCADCRRVELVAASQANGDGGRGGWGSCGPPSATVRRRVLACGCRTTHTCLTRVLRCRRGCAPCSAQSRCSRSERRAMELRILDLSIRVVTDGLAKTSLALRPACHLRFLSSRRRERPASRVKEGRSGRHGGRSLGRGESLSKRCVPSTATPLPWR